MGCLYVKTHFVGSVIALSTPTTSHPLVSLSPRPECVQVRVKDNGFICRSHVLSRLKSVRGRCRLQFGLVQYILVILMGLFFSLSLQFFFLTTNSDFSSPNNVQSTTFYRLLHQFPQQCRLSSLQQICYSLSLMVLFA